MTFFKKENIEIKSDLELIELYKKTKKPRYVGELFKRHSSFIFGICLKYMKQAQLAEDEAMNVFEKLMKVLPKYEILNFKSWLGTLTRNHCLSLLSKNTLSTTSIDALEGLQIMESDDSTSLEKETMLILLEKGLELLSFEQKKCIEMFFLQKLSYKDIAEKTGFELSKVKSYIQNGKRKLSLYLQSA